MSELSSPALPTSTCSGSGIKRHTTTCSVGDSDANEPFTKRLRAPPSPPAPPAASNAENKTISSATLIDPEPASSSSSATTAQTRRAAADRYRIDDDDNDGETLIMLPQFNEALAAQQAAAKAANKTNNRWNQSQHKRGRARGRGGVAPVNAVGSSGGRGRGFARGAPASGTSSSPSTSVSTTNTPTNESDDINNPPTKRMTRVMAAHRERQRALMEEASEAAQRRAMGLPDAPDPLFDPDIDTRDQLWADRQASAALLHSGKARLTDAVLSCPCCFTTLCLDCQQHDEYENQYRAMFVQHCIVDTKSSEEKVRPSGNDDSKQQYLIVRCDACNAVVGERDSDEVYHFYNVIASAAPQIAAARANMEAAAADAGVNFDENDDADDDDNDED